MPLMKLRLAAPAVLVDLVHVPDLRFIRESAEQIVVGAMTRYVDLERSETVRTRLPMLAQAAGTVGDAQVRNRGTIGGSLAHADPAADMPAVVSALGATVRTASPRGSRTIAADELFRDVFETSLAADEVITEVLLPTDAAPAQRYQKFRRRVCDWAVVGVAASLHRDDAGAIRSAAVVLTNVGPKPVHATAMEGLLRGQPSTELLDRAAAVAADGIEPTPELNVPSDYKKHLVRVMTRRALAHALGLNRSDLPDVLLT
jgi:carbon-monoxide dehydrogenase medium subunit